MAWQSWKMGQSCRNFPNHISYGPRQIREQIKAAYDAGYEEWILWNATVRYQSDSLLTPEEAEAERQRWEAGKPEPEKSVSENSMHMSTVQ